MTSGVSKTISFVESCLVADMGNHQISLSRLKVIILFPFALLLFYSVFLAFPVTRQAALWTLEENGPVELLTFLFAMVGGIQGLVLVQQVREHREPILVSGFYLAFSAGLIFLGMEEVAWGQWFFGFETPTYWNEINNQEELTLHNLEIFNHHLEIFPLIFGLGGLVGAWLSSRPWVPHITPPLILLPWFLLITIVSSIDLIQDFYILQKQLDYLVNFLDEVIELMVGISGFLFIWFGKKKFGIVWKKKMGRVDCEERFKQTSPFG
ncbi:MAG: hypothetical protein NPIRA01_08630 [Nitrospirales bacterium]|nr:MAG: hypothetical protein NPIRA01_08630 [Nitrospirales bacterium]